MAFTENSESVERVNTTLVKSDSFGTASSPRALRKAQSTVVARETGSTRSVPRKPSLCSGTLATRDGSGVFDAAADDDKEPQQGSENASPMGRSSSSAHFGEDSPVASPRAKPTNLLWIAAKEVTAIFAPVVAYHDTGRQRRSSSFSSLTPSSVKVHHLGIDPALLVDLRPAPEAPAPTGHHEKSAESRHRHHRNGGGSSAANEATAGFPLNSPGATQLMALGFVPPSDLHLESSALSITSNTVGHEGSPSGSLLHDGDAARGGAAIGGPSSNTQDYDSAYPQVARSRARFFQSSVTGDAFEQDDFTPESRRKFLDDKAHDEELEGKLMPFQQQLVGRMANLANEREKTIFQGNVQFVTQACMWKSLFAFVRFAHVANMRLKEEIVLQRVIKQLAPLCAIRLRQRLKRTKIRFLEQGENVRRPTIEIFKADRTFSHFPEEQLEQIRLRMTLVYFFRYEALLYRGVQDDQCFVLERGHAETRDGLSSLVVHRRHQSIGALGMIAGEPRLHTVVACSECWAWRISRADFLETLNMSDPKTRNAMSVVNELRQKNIRDVYYSFLQPHSLRQFLLFSGIRDTILETIISDASPKVIKRGDALLRAGDSAVTAYFVVRGRVRLSISTQLPLSRTKGIPQLVAESVCLLQPRRRQNTIPASDGGAQRRRTQVNGSEAHLILRGDQDDKAAMSSSVGSASILVSSLQGNAALASSDRTRQHGGGAGGGTSSSPSNGGKNASLTVLSTSEEQRFHEPGMACDISCPVLISVPQLMEGSKHHFHVQALSESVDCLVLHGDRLRAALKTDRETTKAFEYNLTCLTLPFIRPLPRMELLRTLFPQPFAFEFLPKMPVEDLDQVPVVFAPDDSIVMDSGPDACAVVVFKGAMQGFANRPTPYLWPEVSFVLTPGASCFVKALSPIEGVLIRRSQFCELPSSLKPQERGVFLDAVRAHYSMLGGRPMAARMVGAEEKRSSKDTAHTGNQRIRMALYGFTDLAAEVAANSGGPSDHATKNRINPLIRGELNALNAPRRPDRSLPMREWIARKISHSHDPGALASTETPVPPASPGAVMQPSSSRSSPTSDGRSYSPVLQPSFSSSPPAKRSTLPAALSVDVLRDIAGGVSEDFPRESGCLPSTTMASFGLGCGCASKPSTMDATHSRASRSGAAFSPMVVAATPALVLRPPSEIAQAVLRSPWATSGNKSVQRAESSGVLEESLERALLCRFYVQRDAPPTSHGDVERARAATNHRSTCNEPVPMFSPHELPPLVDLLRPQPLSPRRAPAALPVAAPLAVASASAMHLECSILRRRQEELLRRYQEAQSESARSCAVLTHSARSAQQSEILSSPSTRLMNVSRAQKLYDKTFGSQRVPEMLHNKRSRR